jgi:3-isopropylmalate dehydrogenase
LIKSHNTTIIIGYSVVVVMAPQFGGGYSPEFPGLQGSGLFQPLFKNLFVSYVFFRKIFDEVAAENSDIEKGYSYVDAMALDMVCKPWDFDVLVAENMFADILSDLGGGIVGGMGMASCAEIGKNHALFQPAHGSAPDIAGQDMANPTATLLAAAMMLEWLGGRSENESCLVAAKTLEDAIEQGFSDKILCPMEFGGPDGTKAYTNKLVEMLKNNKFDAIS